MAIITLYFGDPSKYSERKLITCYGGSDPIIKHKSCGKVCGPVVSTGGGANEELGFSSDDLSSPYDWDPSQIIGTQKSIGYRGTIPWGWSIMGRSSVYWERTPTETFNYDDASWTWFFNATCNPSDFSADPWMKLQIQEDISGLGWTNIFSIEKLMDVNGNFSYSKIISPPSGFSNDGPNKIRGEVFSGWFTGTPT